MKIIVPNYILVGDTLLTNQAIAYDKTIQKIDSFEALSILYPDAQVEHLKEHSLLMSGLINAHVHIEFSANKTELSYGDFLPWLYSVIENREELMEGEATQSMEKAVDAMLQNGITTFGAISSHGIDLDVCQKAKQNVVYFNEVIGSQATMADALFADFLSRLDASKGISREGFFPAVAVHSPYSVHPVLIKKAIDIVKNEKLKLTAHFMESKAEREWLDSSQGDFKSFFKELLKQEHCVCDAQEFLSFFDDVPTLLTHAVETNEAERETIAKHKHTVIHCPISNRLLGNPTLNIKELNDKSIPWILATDGLSSNYALDLFEEMKLSLFMHPSAPLLGFAKSLIHSVTKGAADALGLNTGEIKEGKNADFIILDLEKEPNDELAIHLILHRYNISHVYINGTKEI